MKERKSISKSDKMREKIVKHVKSELSAIDPQALIQLNENSLRNLLLVEAISDSLRD